MSTRKLLLADDSITIQKVVNLTFADEGIEVITFGDGDAALDGIEEIKPDIVLADVNMPGLNGYQLCELIRGNEATKSVPVVLLVGSFEPFDKDEADRVGADRYLTKPFSSIAELVATVNDLLKNGVHKSEMPDTNDIDALYEQSFVETVELPRGENLGGEFSDDGIDDEMIQTSYADSDIDSLAEASFFEPDEIDDFIGGPDTYRSTVDAADTAIGQDFLAPEADEATSDMEAIVEDVLPNKNSLHPFASAETLSFENNELESNSLKFQFDDLDLLELPGVPEKSYNFTTPEQALDAGSKTQVVSLSPELIDIIVQKVVEKLAEKY